ncbi:hypothetical protein BDP55DRAFT_223576 [Colletotrichum godetiae]|uniref:Uncharacterized protein n=1 Tax=Colletotrichum godetiae TaxID=1209918 RepID=A0AAJ0AKI3_9PEZI|nr:uncharacterized protein BDP55DRAFT_223576 [Colletotrichum godetiae]KAK1673396.1 hypothetical protein BDP55DRAFT_223576 [Colletotrichum godetiae]
MAITDCGRLLHQGRRANITDRVSSNWAPGERLSRHGNRLAGGLGDGSRDSMPGKDDPRKNHRGSPQGLHWHKLYRPVDGAPKHAEAREPRELWRGLSVLWRATFL